MIKAILTDIEGTTSSLSFVKDELFPYARRKMGDFIRHYAHTPEVALWVAEVREMAGLTDADDPEAVISQLIEWIDQDRKLTPLKSLQGMIWEEGYRNGDFFGHVYEDAVARLQDWKRRGLQLAIYSSGSVHAQKLLFAHTASGDLTPLFSGYFDTQVGAKQDVKSYDEIARRMAFESAEILFLSDMPGELDAAREAGFAVCRLVRDEGVLPSEDAYPAVRDFDDVDALLRQGIFGAAGSE